MTMIPRESFGHDASSMLVTFSDYTTSSEDKRGKKKRRKNKDCVCFVEAVTTVFPLLLFS